MAKGKKPAKRGLNDRQRAFVEFYLTSWNASEAARQTGYKSKPNVHGSRLLANVSIRAEIDARLSEMGMSANEVLARLAAHARGDISPFLAHSVGEVHFDLTTEEAQQNIHLIKKVKSKARRGVGRTGEEWEETETEIELHDPQAALVHLGRYHKLFTDKAETEHSGETILRVVYDTKRVDDSFADAAPDTA